MTARTEATLDDFYRVEEGKAEIVNGKLVLMPATGDVPHLADLRIAMSLLQHRDTTGRGHAFGDGGTFVVDLPKRHTFSPDAAFAYMPLNGMRFHDGPPVFAVEVRSEGDYGKAAEREMAAKRRDYFAAGTLVVWDVEPVARTVAEYVDDAEAPAATFGIGEAADAVPALPDWRMATAAIFR